MCPRKPVCPAACRSTDAVNWDPGSSSSQVSDCEKPIIGRGGLHLTLLLRTPRQTRNHVRHDSIVKQVLYETCRVCESPSMELRRATGRPLFIAYRLALYSLGSGEVPDAFARSSSQELLTEARFLAPVKGACLHSRAQVTECTSTSCDPPIAPRPRAVLQTTQPQLRRCSGMSRCNSYNTWPRPTH